VLKRVEWSEDSKVSFVVQVHLPFGELASRPYPESSTTFHNKTGKHSLIPAPPSLLRTAAWFCQRSVGGSRWREHRRGNTEHGAGSSGGLTVSPGYTHPWAAACSGTRVDMKTDSCFRTEPSRRFIYSTPPAGRDQQSRGGAAVMTLIVRTGSRQRPVELQALSLLPSHWKCRR